MSSAAVRSGDGDEPLAPVVPLPLAPPPSELEADVLPDDIAAWASGALPGAQVLVPLVRAARTGRLSAAGRVDALTAMERARAWLEAQQLHLIAEMSAAAPPDEAEQDWVREDVAAALRLSRVSAINRLEFAKSLRRLPTTAAALREGVITVMHARAITDETVRLDDVQIAAVEQRVYERAATQTVGEFRQSVKRAVLRVDAATAEERHQRAREDRRVTFRPVPDGMEEVWALLPADRSAALRARLNAEAAWVAPGDIRTADQRRADALCALAEQPLGAPAHPGPARTSGDTESIPREHGMRPAVQVTVAASTLLGLDHEPAELAGYGPISAGLARQLAADPTGTWRRLVVDEQGKLLDYGRTTYRPPVDLMRYVIARDRVCQFPGCSRQAARCDLDHCQGWADGGATSASNLFALCKRHHRLKHETSWRYEQLEDGDVMWTSPTGHEYRKQAAPYPIEPTAHGPDPPF